MSMSVWADEEAVASGVALMFVCPHKDTGNREQKKNKTADKELKRT